MSSVPSWYGVEVADLYKRYILECWVHLHGKKKKRLLKYGQGDGAPGSTMKRENNSRGTNDNSDNQDSDDHDKGDRAQHIWKFIRCFWKGLIPGLVVGACVTYFASRGGFNMQGFLVKPKKGLFKASRRQESNSEVVNLPPLSDRMEMGTKQVTVKDGDSLWAIIARNMGEYNSENRFRVEKMNQDILGNNSELLRPGMTLRMPNFISRSEYQAKLDSAKADTPGFIDEQQHSGTTPADNEGIDRVPISGTDLLELDVSTGQSRVESENDASALGPVIAVNDMRSSAEFRPRDNATSVAEPFPRG